MYFSGTEKRKKDIFSSAFFIHLWNITPNILPQCI